MKVALVNGSPRGKKASSLSLLGGLKNYLKEADEALQIQEMMWNKPDSGTKDFDEILQNDVIVFAFPLYIDSIPSHLLRNLVNLDQHISEIRNSKGVEVVTTKKVYVILNNGFFEGKQNRLAVENMEHWCNRVGFTMAQGIGIGGGGMLSGIEGVPYGKGPKARIGKALEAMATNILSGQGADFTFMEPNFPGVAYKLAAEIGWRQGIRKNGLKTKDLGRRL